MSYADTLSTVPLFQDLPKKSIDRLTKFVRPRSFEAGDVIFREGEEGVGFFVITSGKVKVVCEGNELATLAEGGFFGEMALLDNHRRSATVQAISDTETLAIMRADFLAELRTNPDLSVELLSVLSRRIRDLDVQLGNATKAAHFALSW